MLPERKSQPSFQPPYVPAKRDHRPGSAIPDPTPDPKALYRTAMATKEMVETLGGHRGAVHDRAVTWGDLLKLGLVTPPDLPQR